MQLRQVCLSILPVIDIAHTGDPCAASQVFTAKSTEFREAIVSILRVKLVFYPNEQVSVMSQFDLNAAARSCKCSSSPKARAVWRSSRS